MKNKFFMAGIAVVLLLFLMILSSCGPNPKALAKHSYELGQQTLGALMNPSKTAELAKKAADIEKKVAKLSDSDKVIYSQELARLSAKGLGGLLDAAGGLLDTATQQSTQQTLDATQKAAKQALDATQQVLDATQQATDAAKQATDAAEQASGLLKTFGF
jgi:2-phospho-L-lactate transferase/gluconeogenesis factor (CofD/UPF0052 family)